MIAVGTIAAEVRRSREARKRIKDDLTEFERPFASLFMGPDTGEAAVRYVVYGGLGCVALVMGGIFALRSATDGSLGGLVFGFLATAIALGSWANSYTHADEVADKLEAFEEAYVKDLERHEQLASGGPREEQARQAEIARSVREEYKDRGKAASERVLAAGFEAMLANPAVAGHGRSQGAAEPGSRGQGRVQEVERPVTAGTDGEQHEVVLEPVTLAQVELSGDGTTPQGTS